MKRRLKFSANTYAATLYQLCTALFVLWLTRLFFYFYNADVFAGLPAGEFCRLMANGLRFDVITLLYLNIVFITMRLLPFRFTRRKGYRRAEDWIFAIFNGIGIAANIADTPYFRFTNIRTNVPLLEEFLQDTNATGIIGGHLFTYWYLLPIAAAFIFLLVWLYKRVEIPAEPLFRDNAAGYAVRTGILVAAYAVVVIIIRGGIFDGRPIGVGEAVRYVKRNRDIAVVLNTPFSVLRTIGKDNAIEELTYFSDAEAEAIYSPYYPPRDSVGEFRAKNVVILLLEGIGVPFVQSVNNIEGTVKDSLPLMPFLESLCDRSLVFTEAYSTGTKSSEGITAVLGGFPVFQPTIYMTSPHNTNDIDGVPALLGDKGYSSVFYCGCFRGSYGFEAFGLAAGYRRFVGRDEYGGEPSDCEPHWGIFDDRMGKFITSDLAGMQQPFAAAWFTLTSHGPYIIPEEFRSRYRSPDLTIEQTVEYVDDVLEEFFRDASAADWYENTLFVITADHSRLMPDPIYNSPNTLYHIPLILFTPDGSIDPGVDPLPASQLDITPTVLGYMNYNEPRVSMGNDLLDPASRRFAVNRVNNIYQIMEGDYLLQFDTGTGKPAALYNRIEDPMLGSDILESEPETAARMEKLVKAFIQQYTHRIRENRLSAAGERN